MSAKLIYVTGPGHSGTTILDIALGSLPSVFSTGELKYLPWQISRSENLVPSVENECLCSCGNTFKNCKFWGDILEKRANQQFPAVELERMDLLSSTQYVPYKSRNVRKTTFSFALFRRSYSYNILGPVVRKAFRLLMTRNLQHNWGLIDLIAKASGVTYVIDSSKDIVRFQLLQSMRHQDCHLVIVKKDLKSLVESAIRRNRDARLACERWLAFYENIFRLAKQNANLPIAVIAYSDFCADPNASIGLLLRELNISIKVERNLRELNPAESHLVAGNPIRLAGPLIVNKDTRYKKLVLTSEMTELIELYEQKYTNLYQEFKASRK